MENYAVVSFMGLAPYWFEMDNSLMVNEEGDVQFVSETEYEWQLTQTSYLQPRIELTANLTDSDKYERQSGLSNLRVGYVIVTKSVVSLPLHWCWNGARQHGR